MGPSGDQLTLRFAIALGVVAVVTVALVTWFFSFEVAPVVTGKSVDDAAAALHDAGISFDAHSAHGTVIDQDPIGGERWFRHQDFVLTYTNDTGTHVIGGPDADG